MKKYNKDIGNYGEDLALDYLNKIGYKLITRNFRCRNGEIDLIFKFEELIIFIEVKSRYSYHFGIPREAVTYLKQKQIFSISKYFLYKYKLLNYNCRYDVIEIYFNKNNNSYYIEHIKDAFRPY
ncbi:YraN family protein [Clostridium sp. AL.422]|uniref:YraN family protein n=1 Tax=Clostridium TaxID=1485 RepID=UPI00293DA830|nr:MULTISPECIES: YraN family protein [unclassified Clostridium]MDV4151184.1 YraN family protein [Clostridium sp. AL.422]